MVGHHKNQPPGQEVQVDANLEEDLSHVERSIATYLQSPNDALRRSLLVTLERLDEQIARSDAYEESVVGSAAWGYASKGEVLGEAGMAPVIEEVPQTELQAQVALVKAAKDDVRGPTPGTLAALRTASAALATIRKARDISP